MRIGIDYTAAVRQQAGIGRYTRELIKALFERDDSHHYTLFAATGGIKRETLALKLGANARLRTIPLSDEWVARLWHRARLPLPVEAITGRQDLFYSPDFVLPPTLPNTRALLTVHDLSFVHYPDHFVPKLVHYLNQVVPRSVRRADRVLADSEATRSDLLQWLGTPPQKVQVIYGGVDARFQPQPAAGERERLQARYGIKEPPYILAVGTIQPRKNYGGLMRAFARLGSPNLQLVIAGRPGWLYKETLAEAEKQPRVQVLGFVPDDDLPALYRQATLFVFPSFYEGFGLPVLEAMACGTPVVCSRASSLPEVAGDAALLIDPHSPAEMAQAMHQAIGDSSLRRQMVARGREQAARFTWQRAASQLLAAFHDC
ncbi:MAG: glycosyltransferase family 4 protein [Anaerolineae bacterium]|nr:glycosyltransferase family 4 protein [Anaerolineae bacterium]